MVVVGSMSGRDIGHFCSTDMMERLGARRSVYDTEINRILHETMLSAARISCVARSGS
jgi:hypothetical protein